MKTIKHLGFYYFMLIFMGCNDKTEKNKFSVGKPYLNDFVISYSEHTKTLQDTNNLFLLFVDTNWKKSKYYILADKNTLFIEQNPPFDYFEINGLFVFVYTGLESTYYQNSIDVNQIIQRFKNDEPAVYNPPIWCLNVSRDTTFINKNPSITEIQSGTDAPYQSKEPIIFIPPNKEKN